MSGKWTLRALCQGGLSLLMLASPAQAAFPGSNGKIAVGVHSQVDRYEFHDNIYVVNPDGSGSTALTSDNASYTPAWSPDGSKIAFGSDRGGNSGIYTMNADGSGATRLTTDPAVRGLPAWSPDGSKIAFVRSGDIYTMNADGSGFTQLTSGPEGDSRPSWSPRGNEIAFERSYWDPNTATSVTSIYLVDTDGTDVRQLVANHAGSPDWSPDGRKIAFSNNYWGGIWVVDVVTGTAPERLTYDSPTAPEYVVAYDDTPAWSPDGTRVVFSRVECRSRLLRVHPASTDQRRWHRTGAGVKWKFSRLAAARRPAAIRLQERGAVLQGPARVPR